MIKGDIILVPFPFTDLTGNKIRPALVLIGGELDVTVSFISTQSKWKEEADILLQPTIENGLKKESLIRLSKIASINNEQVYGRLGKLDSSALDLVNKNLKLILQLD